MLVATFLLPAGVTLTAPYTLVRLLSFAGSWLHRLYICVKLNALVQILLSRFSGKTVSEIWITPLAMIHIWSIYCGVRRRPSERCCRKTTSGPSRDGEWRSRKRWEAKLEKNIYLFKDIDLLTFGRTQYIFATIEKSLFDSNTIWSTSKITTI